MCGTKAAQSFELNVGNMKRIHRNKHTFTCKFGHLLVAFGDDIERMRFYLYGFDKFSV